MKKLIDNIFREIDNNTILGFFWFSIIFILVFISLFVIIGFPIWLAVVFPKILYFYAMILFVLLGLLIYKTYNKL